jgi:hypothetical protein
MPRSRFVRPDTVTLPLSDGDSITVKRVLTHGEELDTRGRMVRVADGVSRVDPFLIAQAHVVAYLLDWTFVDDAGRHVPIADKSPDEIVAILRALDDDSFEEIADAIAAHRAAVAKERTAEKNGRDGGSRSPATLPSLVGVAGGTSGLPS